MAPGLWCRDYRGARLDEMKPLHDSSQSVQKSVSSVGEWFRCLFGFCLLNFFLLFKLTLLYLLAQGRGGDALGSLDSLVNRLLQYLGAKEVIFYFWFTLINCIPLLLLGTKSYHTRFINSVYLLYWTPPWIPCREDLSLHHQTKIT